MTERGHDERRTETGQVAYDPERYVSRVWIDLMTDAGLSEHQARQVRDLTFGDPELTLGDPSSEDVLRVVVEAVDHYDFESALDADDPAADADALREQLVAVTHAGLTGQLLGPAAAPADVGLDNEGRSTVSTDDVAWSPGEQEREDALGGIDISGADAVAPDPSEMAAGAERQALGFNAELPIPGLTESAIDSLVERAASDGAVTVRAAAVRAIGTIAARAETEERLDELVSTLHAHLDDDEPSVRAAAATALGEALGARTADEADASGTGSAEEH
ncbi:MAG: HEAT repeat domain-containing protein [Haloarculaceae archaeon]